MTFPTLIVEFSPTTGPFDTPVWVDISDRVWSADWVDGKQADLEEFPPGQARIVLRNDDRLFDPEHATGTYFGQLNPRVPFRIRATNLEELVWDGDPLTWDGDDLVWGTATYDLFYGFVEDGWEQTYHPPEGSTCTVKLIDLLGVLSGYTLPSVVAPEILADSPRGFWRLDETSGSVMSDASTNARHGEYTAGTSSLSATIQTPSGGSFPGLNLDGEHVGIVGANVPDFSIGVGALIDISGVIADLTNGDMLVLAEVGGATAKTTYPSLQWGVEIVSTTLKTARLFLRSDLATADFGYSASFDASRPRFVASRAIVALVSDFTTHYVDGVVSTGASNPAAITGVATGFRALGTKANGDNFKGLVSHLIWNSSAAMTAARIAVYADVFLDPLDQQTSDQQIQWILDTVGVPATMYDLDTGQSVMGPLNSLGRDAVELMREIAATEFGGLFVNHSDGGKIRLRQRYASYDDARSTSAQVTFSDDSAALDADVVRVEPDTLRVEPNGISSIINQATVTWRGGTEVVDQSAGSPYGPRPVSIDTQAPTAAAARSLGEWIIAHNATPKSRIRSLGANPGAMHDAFPMVLDCRVYDRADYRSHPQSEGAATTAVLEVLGRHHSVQGLNWDAEFYLTPHPTAGTMPFRWGISEWGGSDVWGF